MRREPQFLDDLSEDGDLAMWAEMSSAAILIILHELSCMPLAECND
jgi:hypothetical protein